MVSIASCLRSTSFQRMWQRKSYRSRMCCWRFEGVLKSSVIKSLTIHVKRQWFSTSPQVCLRASSALLDLVQARPSIFPISSQELFSILDDASERTFLCGAAVSMQKFIFDGEAGKIGLETKNLVAYSSFLVEQKLVQAWLADKDAEALRYQKLLVEKEEAPQKRCMSLIFYV